MKICSKCGKTKEFSEFYKSQGEKDGLQYYCKVCVKESKKNVVVNKERFKQQHLKYRDKNREKLNNKSKKYYKENKVICLKRIKEYRSKNKESINEYNRKYQVKRCQEDDLYRFSKNLRSRLNKVLSGKVKSTQELLGAPFSVVKEYLTTTFTEGMSWENYGEWHVDHKIPLASATTKGEVEKLFHYTNLQALWAEDNLSKGAKGWKSIGKK